MPASRKRLVLLLVGSFQESGVVTAAHNLNNPLIPLTSAPLVPALSKQAVISADPSVIIDTIKVSHQQITDLTLWEL